MKCSSGPVWIFVLSVEPPEVLAAALTGLVRCRRRCGWIVGGKLCAPRRRASTGPDRDPGRVRSSALPGNVKRSGQKEGSVSPSLTLTHTLFFALHTHRPTHTHWSYSNPPHTHTCAHACGRTHLPELRAQRTDMYSPLCLTQVSPFTSGFLPAAAAAAARCRWSAKLPPQPGPHLPGMAAMCSGSVLPGGVRRRYSGSSRRLTAVIGLRQFW